MKKNILLIVSIVIISLLSIYTYQLKSELSKSEHENTKLIIENSELFVKNNKLDFKVSELKQINNTNKEIAKLDSQNPTKIKSSIKEAQKDGNSYYSYKITSVNGDKINGISVDKRSSDNQGIYLLQSELNVQLHKGDEIAIKYGNYGDDIQNIIKLTK